MTDWDPNLIDWWSDGVHVTYCQCGCARWSVISWFSLDPEPFVGDGLETYQAVIAGLAARYPMWAGAAAAYDLDGYSDVIRDDC